MIMSKSAIKEQAIAWYAKLQSDQAEPEDWESFTLWLEESHEHGDAYDALELSLDSLPEDIMSEPEVSIAANENRRGFLWGVTGIGIAALFAAAFFMPNFGGQGTYNIQEFATTIGEQTQVTLADGTKVDLNTNSRLVFAMNKTERIVTLSKGEALFDIAQDSSRSFRVEALDTQIWDVGTLFEVDVSDGDLSVAVIEGLVDVIPENAEDQKKRLTPGQMAERKAGEQNVTVSSADIDVIASWTEGVLSFDEAPLPEIIAELNRYFETPFVIANSALNQETFSGVLNLGSQEELTQTLEKFLPITALKQDGKINLTPRL